MSNKTQQITPFKKIYERYKLQLCIFFSEYIGGGKREKIIPLLPRQYHYFFHTINNQLKTVE